MDKKDKRKKVLFICTHNSARSQMAEAFLNNLYGNKYAAYSAGTDPGGVNLYTREVMDEIGMDMAKHRSKGIREFTDKGMKFDIVVTVCDNARESCPSYIGCGKQIHKGFKDPSAVRGCMKAKKIGFRDVREQIREWIEKEFSD